jgi:hypothetical protein
MVPKTNPGFQPRQKAKNSTVARTNSKSLKPFGRGAAPTFVSRTLIFVSPPLA